MKMREIVAVCMASHMQNIKDYLLITVGFMQNTSCLSKSLELITDEQSEQRFF